MKPAAREFPGMFSQIRKYTVVSECAESPLKIAHDNDVRISGGFPLSIRRGVIYQEMPNNYYCLAHITHRWSTTATAAVAATAATPPSPPLSLCLVVSSSICLHCIRRRDVFFLLFLSSFSPSPSLFRTRVVSQMKRTLQTRD